MRVVTSDLQEAIAAVSRVYTPHDVKVLESNRGIDAVLESSGAGSRQVVTQHYAAPVKIDAGTFEDLLLFMTCVDGAAEATQGRHLVQWEKGRTLPLSRPGARRPCAPTEGFPTLVFRRSTSTRPASFMRVFWGSNRSSPTL